MSASKITHEDHVDSREYTFECDECVEEMVEVGYEWNSTSGEWEEA